MPLRGKLFLSSLVASLVLLAYVMLVWMPRSLQQAEATYHRQLERHVDSIAAGLVPTLLERRLAHLHEDMGSLLKSNPEWLRLEVFNSEGTRVYPLRSRALPAGSHVLHAFKRDIRFLDDRLGEITMTVDFQSYLKAIQQEQRTLLLWLSLGLALFIAVLWVAVDMFVRRPAVALAHAARRLASNDFTAPLPYASRDEIGVMIKSFAAMRETLFSAQSQLTNEIEGHMRAEEDLHQQKERIQVTLHSIGDAVMVTDEHGTIEYANPTAERLTGLPGDQMYGRRIEHICPMFADVQSSASLFHPVAECLSTASQVQPKTHLMLQLPGNTRIPIEITVSPLRDSHGRISGSVMIFRDVTAIRTAHMDAIHQRDRLLRTVVTSAPIILFTVDHSGQITLAEGQDLARWGADRPTQIACLSAELPAIHNDIQRALAGDSFSSYMEGQGATYEVRYSPIIDSIGQVTGVTAVGTDVTERLQAERRLNELAYYDTLSGLPNRQLFQERLKHAMTAADRNNYRIAIMFLDLDRFKSINDSMGHEAGDDLIRAAAQRIVQVIRKEDTLARLGGDEFTIILEDPRLAGSAATVAQKIIDAFAAPFHIQEHELFVTTSIGITFYPDDERQLEGLLRNADTAMYHAKENGRNNFQFYSAKMTTDAYHRLMLENNLRLALERGEFEVFYQPQLDIRTGTIASLEALLRWHHPELGTIRPDQFLLVAEDTGLIHAIGEWVLHAACAQAMAWRKSTGQSPRIAVNVSPRQLKNSRFPNHVREVLRSTGLPPAKLELEVTERSLFEDPEQALRMLSEFPRIGVKLALDDFGTGYSSLNYLTRFPIDTLKIDRSFIDDIGTSQDADAVVSAIMAMASSLRLRVVAEGVEKTTQLDFLQSLQCDAIQGYLFQPELTAAQMSALLARPVGAQEIFYADHI